MIVNKNDRARDRARASKDTVNTSTRRTQRNLLLLLLFVLLKWKMVFVSGRRHIFHLKYSMCMYVYTRVRVCVCGLSAQLLSTLQLCTLYGYLRLPFAVLPYHLCHIKINRRTTNNQNNKVRENFWIKTHNKTCCAVLCC